LLSRLRRADRTAEVVAVAKLVSTLMTSSPSRAPACIVALSCNNHFVFIMPGRPGCPSSSESMIGNALSGAPTRELVDDDVAIAVLDGSAR
jgi:hypothetical protein